MCNRADVQKETEEVRKYCVWSNFEESSARHRRALRVAVVECDETIEENKSEIFHFFFSLTMTTRCE